MDNKGKYIIEITNGMYVNEYDDEAIYFAENKRITLTELLDYADRIMNIDHSTALSRIINHKDFDESYLEGVKDDFEIIEFDDEIIEHYELDIVSHLENYTYFNDYLSEWTEIIHPDLIIGTAGYSPWCEFVTTKNLRDYASDMWDGNNFYDIDIYDENEHLIESYGNVHIAWDNFDTDYIMKEFGLDELNVIENNETERLKDDDKVTFYKKDWSFTFKQV